MFRIPRGANDSGTGTRRPLLLVHGLLSCSDDFVKSGPQNGLGFILADAGYDVWLGNCRATRYFVGENRDKSSKFWDFSLNEMAIYDVSAMIDYILNTTKQENLFYVGYCQGTTLSYILCSEFPAYNKKIIVNMSLAPVAFTKHVQCPVIKILDHLTEKHAVDLYFPNSKFELKDDVRRESAKFIINCKDSENDILCLNDLFVTLGFDPSNVSSTLLPLLLYDNMETHTAKNQFLHYTQIAKTGKFGRFDYGDKNRSKYQGAEVPPKYILSKITCPIVFFVCKHSWLSRSEDIKTLEKELTNSKSIQTIEVDNVWDADYHHLDFLYGKDVAEKVYKLLVEELAKYEDNNINT